MWGELMNVIGRYFVTELNWLNIICYQNNIRIQYECNSWIPIHTYLKSNVSLTTNSLAVESIVWSQWLYDSVTVPFSWSRQSKHIVTRHVVRVSKQMCFWKHSFINVKTRKFIHVYEVRVIFRFLEFVENDDNSVLRWSICLKDPVTTKWIRVMRICFCLCPTVSNSGIY